jgi:hypothetical protein
MDSCLQFHDEKPHAIFRWFVVVRKGLHHSLCFSITAPSTKARKGRLKDSVVLYLASMNPPALSVIAIGESVALATQMTGAVPRPAPDRIIHSHQHSPAVQAGTPPWPLPASHTPPGHTTAHAAQASPAHTAVPAAQASPAHTAVPAARV